MKKLTHEEWEKLYKAKRKKYEEMGIIDFQEKRIARMWDDPNLALDEIPSQVFTWDKELSCFVTFVEDGEI